MNSAFEWILTGKVQGVGFRPFVVNLARKHKLVGSVRNNLGQVEIQAEGTARNLEAFKGALISRAPPMSSPVIKEETSVEPTFVSKRVAEDFVILESKSDAEADIHLLEDHALCLDCKVELHDVADRRYQYPFINCTRCGPRYTIIEALPYDRKNTSMGNFSMCDRCLAEYTATDNRRFHAEPIACWQCGPMLQFASEDGETASAITGPDAIDAAVAAIQEGLILAIKGVGGYHLVCDAANDEAVLRLRQKKHRPHKPLALLMPESGIDGMDVVRQFVEVDILSAGQLIHSSRPILLQPEKRNPSISNAVAPGLAELGVMLPPSPMHELLMQRLEKPIVATSANISGEPVLTDDAEVRLRMASIAEGWLSYNRKIVRPADDTVKRNIHGQPRMIRTGRGSAPLELLLPYPLTTPVIGVGGHLKNTITLAWDNRLVVSPHIGDLTSLRSQHVFQQVIEDLQRLYRIEAQTIVCDLHPHYASTRWAMKQELPVVQVQHHRAHASALAGEHDRNDTGLVFTWDGVGLGDDKTLWGGETFIGSPGEWHRVATFRNFRLSGGDQVALDPWRSAAALHWELQETYQPDNRSGDLQLAHAAWQKGINTNTTTAVGRLFDAAASMLDLVHNASHEGEGPMLLEAIAESVSLDTSLPVVNENGLLEVDWRPLFYMLKGESASSESLSIEALSIEERAGGFHILLTNAIISVVETILKEQAFDYVGLTGGVFQNRLLTELIATRLEARGITCLIHTDIPANDGGVSYGQIIEHAASLSLKNGQAG